MKTVRVLFAIVAIAVAGVSVYANSFAVQFYRSSVIYTALPTTPVPACDFTTSPGCPADAGLICEQEIDDTHFYIVSKRIDGGTCQLARRTQ